MGGNEVSSENVMCLGSIEVPKKEKEKEERESCHEQGSHHRPQETFRLNGRSYLDKSQQPKVKNQKFKQTIWRRKGQDEEKTQLRRKSNS